MTARRRAFFAAVMGIGLGAAFTASNGSAVGVPMGIAFAVIYWIVWGTMPS